MEDAFDKTGADAFLKVKRRKRSSRDYAQTPTVGYKFRSNRKSRTRKQRRAIAREQQNGGFNEFYLRHIKSPAWRMFCLEIRMQRGGKCEQCGSAKNLHVHHLTYKNLGHEIPADVKLVCKPCHEKIHGRAFA